MKPSTKVCDVALKHAMNLASIVKVATKVSFTLLHDTTSLASMKMYPEVDLRESVQPA